MIILNVGLLTSANHYNADKRVITEQDALAAVAKYFHHVKRFAVKQSATEQTLIVYVTDPYYELEIKQRLLSLAIDLEQDCIAAYDALDGIGYLEGEHADDWGGEFNPKYFVGYKALSH